MKSFNLPEENKNEKQSRCFTPNIYRKPVLMEEGQNEQSADYSSASLVNCAQESRIYGREKDITLKSSDFDLNDLIRKEAQLQEIKTRYDEDIKVYEEKQKQIEELKKQFDEQEKALFKKCSILKSASDRASRAVSSLEKEKLGGQRKEFEKQLEEFTALKDNYEKELRNYNEKVAELETLKSAYKAEFEEYSTKKRELEKQRNSLEDIISRNEEISPQLSELRFPAAMEFIKSSYYRELKELKRKRADIESLRMELQDEESLLTEKSSSIENMKEHIQRELSELSPRAQELEKSLFEYEEKKKSFEDKMKTLEARKSELETEKEKFRIKCEEKSRLETEMEKDLEEMEEKRKELDEMVEKTRKEIGVHATIHRQDLDIKKLNNKLEQQALYIQSLESSIEDLKKSLNEAKSDVRTKEVFSEILRQNMELI